MMKMRLFFFVITTSCLQIVIGQESTKLEIGSMQNGQIKLGQRINYKVVMKSGEFALLNVNQMGIDLIIETQSPEGTKIETFDSLNGRNGDEIALIDAKEGGEYFVVIYPLGEPKRVKKGSYSITLINISNTISDHLDQSIDHLAARGFIPGGSVSLLSSEKPFYSRSFGFSNLKDQSKYNEHTIQGVASISKTFIGIAMMMLVEEGLLDLDEDINTYLPFPVVNPYSASDKITLRHLGTHTAGIKDGKNGMKACFIEDDDPALQQEFSKSIQKELKFIAKSEAIGVEDFLRAFLVKGGKYYSKKNFFKRESGAAWYYSNIGAALVSFIIENVSGQEYHEFVRSRILEPLGLKETHWDFEADEIENLTRGYDMFGNEIPCMKCATSSTGGLMMSSSDLNKYMKFWMNAAKGNKPGVLSQSSIDELMKVQHEEVTGQFKGVKNGLFWWQYRDGKEGHDGGEYGISARMHFDRKSGKGFTFIENIMPSESDDSSVQSSTMKMVLERYLEQF